MASSSPDIQVNIQKNVDVSLPNHSTHSTNSIFSTSTPPKDTTKKKHGLQQLRDHHQRQQHKWNDQPPTIPNEAKGFAPKGLIWSRFLEGYRKVPREKFQKVPNCFPVVQNVNGVFFLFLLGCLGGAYTLDKIEIHGVCHYRKDF